MLEIVAPILLALFFASQETPFGADMKSMSTITPTPNPKSLVMLDATGKVATLKLTTSTGLHVYDGSMLWVNPAQSVTAAAPRSSQTAPRQDTGILLRLSR